MSELTYPGNASHPGLRDALERVRPRMAALDRTNLSSVNLDPFAAASQIRGAIPGLLSLRSDLLDRLNRFDASNLDLLDTFALALLQAESVYRAATTNRGEAAQLLSEGFKLRESMVADTKRLAERGLVPRARLADLRVPNGYRNIGADLLSLATLLRENWPNIAHRTPTQLAELDRAEILAERLLCSIAGRNRRTVAGNCAADDRRRAFTLLVNAYDEVRRSVVYLRWREKDADRFAPSLYRKRISRRAKSIATALGANDGADGRNSASNDATESATEAQPASNPGVANGKLTDPVVH